MLLEQLLAQRDRDSIWARFCASLSTRTNKKAKRKRHRQKHLLKKKAEGENRKKKRRIWRRRGGIFINIDYDSLWLSHIAQRGILFRRTFLPNHFSPWLTNRTVNNLFSFWQTHFLLLTTLFIDKTFLYCVNIEICLIWSILHLASAGVFVGVRQRLRGFGMAGLSVGDNQQIEQL